MALVAGALRLGGLGRLGDFFSVQSAFGRTEIFVRAVDEYAGSAVDLRVSGTVVKRAKLVYFHAVLDADARLWGHVFVRPFGVAFLDRWLGSLVFI